MIVVKSNASQKDIKSHTGSQMEAMTDLSWTTADVCENNVGELGNFISFCDAYGFILQNIFQD